MDMEPFRNVIVRMANNLRKVGAIVTTTSRI